MFIVNDMFDCLGTCIPSGVIHKLGNKLEDKLIEKDYYNVGRTGVPEHSEDVVLIVIGELFGCA